GGAPGLLLGRLATGGGLQALDQPAERARIVRAERLAGGVLQVEDVQRLAGVGGEDPRADHIGAGADDRGGEVDEQAPAVGGGDHQLGGVAVGADAALGGGSPFYVIGARATGQGG